MASILATKKAIEDKKFDTTAVKLYGMSGCQHARARYLGLLSIYQETFANEEGEGDVSLFSSPGRIEVAGNHTDHNNGKVIAAAISLDTIAVASKNDEGVIRVFSQGYDPIVIKLSKLGKPKKSEYGKASAIVKGLCAYLSDNKYEIGGFDAVTTSSVFKGAGVSSSSSFELLIVEMLNVFYNDGKMPPIFKAVASKYAENEYFGKPSGLMDQMSIAAGGINIIDFKEAVPDIQALRWNFHSHDIFVVNTGGDHCDLTAEYAAIKSEMESVAAHFGKKVLRDVKFADFWKAVPELSTSVKGRAILRALHYFEENNRVELLAKSLVSMDQKAFFELIKSSGASSQSLLQNLHAEGDLAQRVELGVEISKRMPGVSAVRVHGGGFGGTILCFVDKQHSKGYYDKMKSIFGQENIFKVDIRKDGAKEVKVEDILSEKPESKTPMGVFPPFNPSSVAGAAQGAPLQGMPGQGLPVQSAFQQGVQVQQGGSPAGGMTYAPIKKK